MKSKNPILQLWREVRAQYRYQEVALGPISGTHTTRWRIGRREQAELLTLWLDDPDDEWTLEGQMGLDTTPEERAFARRVLERLLVQYADVYVPGA